MNTFRISHVILVVLLFLIFMPAYAQTPADVDETVRIIKNRRNYPDYCLVAAHRGYWADAPENSLKAYELAIQAGADILEMDVMLSQDEEMVVFHDWCLDRTTNGFGRVRSMSWEEVSGLRLKMLNGTLTDEHVVKLEDALDFLKGKIVASIDIKEGGNTYNRILLRVIALLKEKGMLGQTIIKGKLRYNNLMSLLQQAGVTLDDFIYTPIAFANTANFDSYIREFVTSGKIYGFELVFKQSADPLLPYMEMLEQSSIWAGQYSFWPETSYGIFAQKSPLVDCDPIIRDYNFNDKDPKDPLDDGRGDWDWLTDHGANYIITDRSELLIDYLQALGKRNKGQ